LAFNNVVSCLTAGDSLFHSGMYVYAQSCQQNMNDYRFVNFVNFVLQFMSIHVVAGNVYVCMYVCSLLLSWDFNFTSPYNSHCLLTNLT